MDERFGRRYEDDERRFAEPAPGEYEGRRYRGEGYYGGYYQPTRSRGVYGRRDWPEDRGFLDRAGDELRSWFGDEEAEHRRREDEREARRRGWPSGRWGDGRERWGEGRDRWAEDRDRERGDYPDERTWARQWGYVESPYERDGMSGDRQRSWGTSYGPGPAMRDDAWTARGPYAGRGPKGYQRADERIREDICDRLCEHGGIDASNVEVQVLGTEVTLIGFVPTRSQKRLAEDVVDSVSGVNEVHNQLRVSPSAPISQPGPASSQPGTPGSPSSPGQQSPMDWRNRAA
jgi:osmotically-inducible protein OsmY